MKQEDGGDLHVIGSAELVQALQEGWSGQAILTPSLSRGTLCVADRLGRLVRRLDLARSSHDACFVVTP